jgi:hypothetical protein
MILKRKNIKICVTDEELEYGLGFFMDIGKDNNSWSNNKKTRFLGKSYLGYKMAEGEFYFEDKRIGGSRGWTNADFISYEIKNDSKNSIELKWVLKGKSILFMIVFSLISIAIILASVFGTGEIQFFIRFWTIVLPIMMSIQIIKSIVFFRIVIKDLKKTVETRVKIREYHRGNL